jgi:hypothetical protein
LKTNSAAVKGYQESLSPNEKAQVLVKNAAEQQKHQQSLSLEDKSQMLKNKADAEKNGTSPFLLRKRPDFWIQMPPHKKTIANLFFLITKFKF